MEQISVANLTIKSTVGDTDYLVVDDLSSTYKILAKTLLNSAKEDLLANLYPVGSIYMSVSSTSPTTIFGGTWEQIKDTFLLAAGSTYSAGSTGGESEHTLTINEMPSHIHGVGYRTNNIATGVSGTWYMDPAYSPNKVNGSAVIQPTGGSQAHNNMPPYLTVYMWKRTK